MRDKECEIVEEKMMLIDLRGYLVQGYMLRNEWPYE